ncbi:MAG: hypothetical protein V6Z86_03665 [Hyphomicrobiales bacterium]
MITPFTAHMWGLPVRLLVEVIRSERTVSLRTYEEILDGRGAFTGQEASGESGQIPVGKHGKVIPAADGERTITPGMLLADRFEDRVFCELGAVALDIDALQDRAEWSDHGNWLFPLSTPYSAGTAGLPLAPFNRFPVSFASKMPAPRHLAVAGVNLPLQVYVPFKTCDFTQCSFRLTLHPEYGLVGNLDPGPEHTAAEIPAIGRKALPSLRLDAPSVLEPDANATVDVRVVNNRGRLVSDVAPEVYLEATGGYLPHQRVRADAGTASFRFMALGLEAGDTVRLKAGFRHFSGVAEAEIRVADSVAA